MNKMVTESFGVSQPVLRRAELYNLLDALCHEIELSDSQFNAAKANYEAVGNWLAGSEHESLKKLDIYVHGSTILGTTVKPIGCDEHDVDLICHVPGFSPTRSPAELKKLIGDRLRANRKYAGILEEKKRCWRLNYAREFHLDISPTVPNLNCGNGGELVPDKRLREWKPTNPKGYREIFERRANLVPRLRIAKAFANDAQANIDPFPAQCKKKGILRRTVQLLKRHRDIAFMTVREDIAPISIIITTLASQAYEMCVGRFEFNTELDVVIETIRMMPVFIEQEFVGGKNLWIVNNESTTGENFAERWNSEPARARAFYTWHKQALEDFERFATLEGVDILTREISKSLGSKEVETVVNIRTREISEARSAMKLYVAPAVGLTASTPARATQVLRNTNFGDR
jgi:hypothetical protein